MLLFATPLIFIISGLLHSWWKTQKELNMVTNQLHLLSHDLRNIFSAHGRNVLTEQSINCLTSILDQISLMKGSYYPNIEKIDPVTLILNSISLFKIDHINLTVVGSDLPESVNLDINKYQEAFSNLFCDAIRCCTLKTKSGIIVKISSITGNDLLVVIEFFCPEYAVVNIDNLFNPDEINSGYCHCYRMDSKIESLVNSQLDCIKGEPLLIMKNKSKTNTTASASASTSTLTSTVHLNRSRLISVYFNGGCNIRFNSETNQVKSWLYFADVSTM